MQTTTKQFLCRDVDGLLVAGFGFLQLGVQGLVESGRYDTHENFTVIIQPFLRNPTIPLDQVWPKETYICKELNVSI